ncbi:diaminobutyrate--2-oxoglutarate transaminase [Halobacillus karajensis]|uniref:Diaminobutyrate--2-oxoglutarate transaminase n=1 Tax=Halobacillus karajensis TaxID=195088 RepID=A0A024P8L9_9BACI|nr:diaminobutyrate--2-oxoglutarate transaminase [Halobacillus karajensis]CDQ20077.1 Diaminobutyrate--2-oxoglutarate transaminase [Halobacillus karajensis]CDQ25260.1 Diaminobutyrate--2-oxoglutarate transaminase [Halobacillus karajensis]CDQ28379.1 Diaminobutyrate--2-oxoglutarate transaminase [Halobacillus karajensis]
MTISNPKTDLNVFENYESEVRSYSRSFPTIFDKAKGYQLWDKNGNEYIDFFAGAGALNYGHNDDAMQQKLTEYIQRDGLLHSLDMATNPRAEFLQQFNEVILKPRDMDYKIMFPGPTGTNTVESALKIARKVTNREKVVTFTNAFHGMTIGALSVTGNAFKRHGAGIPLPYSMVMPFDDYMDHFDSLTYLEKMIDDDGSGVDLPAAVILETVQGEGGINAASFEWLKRVEELCRRRDILLIVDDVQAGCGRTGTFFSFEQAGISPDVICLSKSISGSGLPMAITLIKPEYDIWGPGEHNGTFRGNNLAFVTASEALNHWKTNEFSDSILNKSELFKKRLNQFVEEYPELQGKVQGRGLMLGISSEKEGLSGQLAQAAFERGLIIETSGPDDEVLKILPPLIIDEEGIEKGLDIIEESIKAVLGKEEAKV